MEMSYGGNEIDTFLKKAVDSPPSPGLYTRRSQGRGSKFPALMGKASGVFFGFGLLLLLDIVDRGRDAQAAGVCLPDCASNRL